MFTTAHLFAVCVKFNPAITILHYLLITRVFALFAIDCAAAQLRYTTITLSHHQQLALTV